MKGHGCLVQIDALFKGIAIVEVNVKAELSECCVSIYIEYGSIFENVINKCIIFSDHVFRYPSEILKNMCIASCLNIGHAGGECAILRFNGSQNSADLLALFVEEVAAHGMGVGGD